MLNLLKIISIRKYVDRDTATQLTVLLCLTHLEYANSLLIGLLDCSIKLMQKVQNMAAKVVLKIILGNMTVVQKLLKHFIGYQSNSE